jgi:hypothetical protein
MRVTKSECVLESRQLPGQVLRHEVPVVRVDDPERLPADQLPWNVAQHLRGGRIDLREAAPLVQHVDRVRRGLDEPPVVRLRRLQLSTRSAAPADIGHDPAQEAGYTLRIGQDPHPVLHPDHRPVGGTGPVLELVVPRTLRGVEAEANRPLPVFRVQHDVLPETRLGPTTQTVTEDGLGRPAHEGEAPVDRIHLPHDRVQVVHHLGEAAIGSSARGRREHPRRGPQQPDLYPYRNRHLLEQPPIPVAPLARLLIHHPERRGLPHPRLSPRLRRVRRRAMAEAGSGPLDWSAAVAPASEPEETPASRDDPGTSASRMSAGRPNPPRISSPSASPSAISACGASTTRAASRERRSNGSSAAKIDPLGAGGKPLAAVHHRRNIGCGGLCLQAARSGWWRIRAASTSSP